MIFGIGNDIIEIARIEKAIDNPKFKERVFTPGEIEAIDLKGGRAESYAGRFSAKEAVSKALGTGVRNFQLKDIEIINNQLGKPEVNLHGDLKEKYKDFKIEISISHCKEYTTATAIIFKKEEL